MRYQIADFWPWFNGLPDASKAAYLALFVAPLCSLAVGIFAAIYTARTAINRAELEQRLKKQFKLFGDKLDALAARDETRFNYRFTNTAETSKEIFKKASELLASASTLLGEKSKPLEIRTAEDSKTIKRLETQFREDLRALSLLSHSVIYLLDRKTLDALEMFYIASAEIASIGQNPNESDRAACYIDAMRALKRVENEFRQFIDGAQNEKGVPG